MLCLYSIGGVPLGAMSCLAPMRSALIVERTSAAACRVPETQMLQPLLDAHLAPALRGGLAAGHVLRRYAQAGADDLVVLMRRPHTPVSFAALRS